MPLRLSVSALWQKAGLCGETQLPRIPTGGVGVHLPALCQAGRQRAARGRRSLGCERAQLSPNAAAFAPTTLGWLPGTGLRGKAVLPALGK